MTIITSTS
jgi:hypothetical protein